MKNSKIRNRIVAALTGVALAVPMSLVAVAPAAQAGWFTQVCHSSNSAHGNIPVKRQGYSGYVSLYRGQCMTGVELIANFGYHYHITDWGHVYNYGEYRTPQTKTYIVRAY